MMELLSVVYCVCVMWRGLVGFVEMNLMLMLMFVCDEFVL